MSNNTPSSHSNSGRPKGAILHAQSIHKTYRMGSVEVPVLKGASLEVKHGEWVAILGASGSGKSTLLHVLGDLDQPDSKGGNVEFEGTDLQTLSQRARDQYRNCAVGFVFQFYHLLPELNVLENTVLPEMIRSSTRGWFIGALAGCIGLCLGAGTGWVLWSSIGSIFEATSNRSEGFVVVGAMLGFIASILMWPRVCLQYLPQFRQASARSGEILESFGLGHRLKHRPRELSGGERQRVAIARALMNKPQVLLADEPTGNLDEKTGQEILDLIAQQHRDGLTIVMVTHDPAIAKRADRIVRLHDGRVVEST